MGTVSVLRLGDGPRYGSDDLELVCELARRAALAIDNARLFSRLQATEQRLEAVLASVAEAITVVDEQGQTIYANQAAAELLGVESPRELTSAAPGSIMPRFLVLDEQGRELDLECMPGRRLFRGEQAEPLLVRNIVRATGEERWLIVRSTPIREPDGGRVLYAVNVFENITEVKRVERSESFMAEASRVLASSMDYGETLGRVAQLAVPQIADWCAVDLLTEQDTIERVAVHHSDPARLALAEELDRGYQPALDEPEGVPEVIRTGEARIFTDIQPDALAAYARDNEHYELLSAIGATSVIIVPMAGPTKTIGAITLVSAESTRRLSTPTSHWRFGSGDVRARPSKTRTCIQSAHGSRTPSRRRCCRSRCRRFPRSRSRRATAPPVNSTRSAATSTMCLPTVRTDGYSRSATCAARDREQPA